MNKEEQIRELYHIIGEAYSKGESEEHYPLYDMAVAVYAAGYRKLPLCPKCKGTGQYDSGDPMVKITGDYSCETCDGSGFKKPKVLSALEILAIIKRVGDTSIHLGDAVEVLLQAQVDDAWKQIGGKE